MILFLKLLPFTDNRNFFSLTKKEGNFRQLCKFEKILSRIPNYFNSNEFLYTLCEIIGQSNEDGTSPSVIRGGRDEWLIKVCG